MQNDKVMFNKRILRNILEQTFIADLISSQQTTYVKNRHIGENKRLIPDVTEIAKIKKNMVLVKIVS